MHAPFAVAHESRAPSSRVARCDGVNAPVKQCHDDGRDPEGAERRVDDVSRLERQSALELFARIRSRLNGRAQLKLAFWSGCCES